MAPPVVRSASAAGEVSGTDVVILTKPAGLAVGDYMLGVHAADADAVIASMVESGFALLDDQTPSSTNNYPACKIVGKVATSTDVAAADFRFTDTSASGSTGVLAAIQAGTYDPLNPVTINSTWTVSPRPTTFVNANQTAPSITADVDDLLLAIFATDTNGRAQVYPATGATGSPAGMTLVGQVQSGGNYSMVGVYREAITVAGATGTNVVTPALNGGDSLIYNGYVATQIVINPVATILVGVSDTATQTEQATVAKSTQVTASDSATLSEAVTGRALAATADVATETDVGTASVLAAQPVFGSDTATLTESGTGRPALAPSTTLAPRTTLAPSAGSPGGLTITRTGGTGSTDSATLGERAYRTPYGPLGEVTVEGPDIASVAHLVDVAASEIAVETDRTFVGQTAPGTQEVELAGPDLTIGKGGSPTTTEATARGLPPVYAPQPWRLLAQRILTGEWMSWDLPVTDPEIEWTLSGTTTISGSFKPEIREVADLGLEPWGTWIHLEEDGVIRGSAILQPTSIQPDGTLAITAVGTHGYASRIPYRDRLSLVQVDPADIVRMLWAHIQGFPRGNLGVQVLGSTPITIGTEARDVDFVTGEGEVVSFVAGPYTLNWWENTIIGAEIEKLGTDTPFDFTEWSGWANAARTSVAHRIYIDYPQRGTRRFDLRFTEDENVVEKAPIEEPNDAYADTVLVAGKGEGIDQIAGSASYWVGQRLRLPAILDDKTIDNTSRANKIAQDELAARLSALVEVPEIVIDSRHRNAPLGSFDPGDDIRPQLRYPYGANVAQWHRVTAVRYLPTRNRAVVSMSRRGEYRG